jgi:hypothetical protein
MATITNKMLTKLVRDLGFKSGELTEKENRFWHHPDGTTVVLPNNKMGVQPHKLICSRSAVI